MAQPAADRASRDAFELYVLPELEVLARVALSITGSLPDAEDLVQKTLVCAYLLVVAFWVAGVASIGAYA